MTGWKLAAPGARAGANEPLRIYVSQHWQKRLIWIGVVLAGFSIWFIGANGGLVRAGWLLLGAAAALEVLNIVSRVPVQECSLCRKPRREVKRLVAAPSIGICDQCAPYPLAVILEQLEREGKTPEGLLLLLRVLPPGTPSAVCVALFEQALAATPSVEQLRALANEFSRLQAHDSVLAALFAIPESERSGSDWLNVGVCLGELGRIDEALAANEKTRELDPEYLGALALNNSAWYRVRAEGGVEAAELERCLRDVAEAKTLLQSQGPGKATTALAGCFGTEAEARRQSGDAAGALAALDEADKLHAPNEARLFVRARVEADLGHDAAARRSAQRAIDKAPPGSKTQREARELLAGLGDDEDAKAT